LQIGLPFPAWQRGEVCLRAKGIRSTTASEVAEAAQALLADLAV
jgi:hypothetical protein